MFLLFGNMLQRNCLFFCYYSVLSSSYMLSPYQFLVLFHFALGVFFSLSFSLVYQCLSVVQMKYHILLLLIYCGVLYFDCVLKYNLAILLGGKKGKFQRLWRNLFTLLPSLIHIEMRLDNNPKPMSSVCCLLFIIHSSFISVCSVILNYSFAYCCKTSIREFLQICH